MSAASGFKKLMIGVKPWENSKDNEPKPTNVHKSTRISTGGIRTKLKTGVLMGTKPFCS